MVKSEMEPDYDEETKKAFVKLKGIMSADIQKARPISKKFYTPQ